ncbi:MAG: polyprenyl synthetase family protein [Myxococcaceae bacterium]|nr:polyprenyl synthetase family protein [Myxococcaceae bacterium]
MSFELRAWLPATQQRIERLLADRMDLIAVRTPTRLAEAMRYSLLDGGKRLRPALCLAFADALGGGGKAAEDAACALECIHTYSLIHDDLPAMDDDELRRGRPTSHKVFGEALAILAGDALLTEAFWLVTTGPAAEAPARAMMASELAVAAGAGGMVGGQVLDIADDRPAAQEYLMQLHRLKTGALLKAACRLGVLAAKGSAEALAAADRYGEDLGLAFQIADDVLDVTSTAEALGKPVKADSAAGRFTFPAVVGLEASKKLAHDLIVRARQAVLTVEPTPGVLAALAEYSVERTR